MPFNHQEYNAGYLENIRAGNAPVNDAAEKYGVHLEPAEVQIGEKYWKVIGIHHLLPQENYSNHHIYLDALDKDGNRLRNPVSYVEWTWEARRPTESVRPVALEKADNEPGGNIAAGRDQIVSVWMQARDTTQKSDRVIGLKTAHPDEPLPDGALHNTWGHHSFYVVFQETVKTAGSTRTDSLIFGRLTDGAGQTITLLRQDTVIKEWVLDSSATFKFDSLTAGIYTVQVKNVPVKRTGLQLDGRNKVEVNLAMPARQESAITGVVKNGLGYTIILGKRGAVIDRQTIPPDGTFKFQNLPAGVYDLGIWNTAVKATNLEVDGKISRAVNLEVGEDLPQQEKIIDHYVLLGPPQSRGRRASLLIAADYLLNFSLVAGFSVDTAKQSRQVTVIGEGVSPEELQAIKRSGAQVEILSGDGYDLESVLAQRIKAGRAFGDG